MLAQLALPLQAVSAFAAGVCVERGVRKETKSTVLAIIDELTRDLKDSPTRLLRNPVLDRSPEVATKKQLIASYLFCLPDE